MRFLWPQTQHKHKQGVSRLLRLHLMSLLLTRVQGRGGQCRAKAVQGAQLELDCVFTFRLSFSLGLTHAALARVPL